MSCREGESKPTVSSQRSDARHPVSWIQLMAAGRSSDRSADSRTCTIHAVGSGFVSMIARQVEERAATGARSLRSGWDEGQHAWTGRGRDVGRGPNVGRRRNLVRTVREGAEKDEGYEERGETSAARGTTKKRRVTGAEEEWKASRGSETRDEGRG